MAEVGDVADAALPPRHGMSVCRRASNPPDAGFGCEGGSLENCTVAFSGMVVSSCSQDGVVGLGDFDEKQGSWSNGDRRVGQLFGKGGGPFLTLGGPREGRLQILIFCCNFRGVQISVGCGRWVLWWAPPPSIFGGPTRAWGQRGALLSGSPRFTKVDLHGDGPIGGVWAAAPSRVRGLEAQAEASWSEGLLGVVGGGLSGALVGEDEISNHFVEGTELVPCAPAKRASLRLATRDSTGILSQAVARKVCLLEGEGAAAAGVRAPKLSKRKLVAKSRRCGVRLEDAQARDFKEYVRSRA